MEDLCKCLVLLAHVLFFVFFRTCTSVNSTEPDDDDPPKKDSDEALIPKEEYEEGCFAREAHEIIKGGKAVATIPPTPEQRKEESQIYAALCLVRSTTDHALLAPSQRLFYSMGVAALGSLPPILGPLLLHDRGHHVSVVTGYAMNEVHNLQHICRRAYTQIITHHRL